eukprot:6261757-Amphidinium_carterae.1
MQSPGAQAWQAVKRMGRFLLGVPSIVQVVWMQRPPKQLDVFSDANHEVVFKRESQRVVPWSSMGTYISYDMMKLTCATQQPIALSSAESE